MVHLQPITDENVSDLAGTSYDGMPCDEKLRMIADSLRKEHNGSYFELLAVYDEDLLVGFMNLYAHSAEIVSIGPEIKQMYRRRGYGYLGEMQALRYAKDAGFSVAVANVREDNQASIALHEKLGFAVGAHCFSKSGKPIRVYVKNLLRKQGDRV